MATHSSTLRGSLVAQTVKRLPTMQATQVRSLGWEVPLEKEMATHSSILAWKSPWTEEPLGYSPWGHKELDTVEQLHFTSLPVLLPGKSRGLRSLAGHSPWGRGESDTTERLHFDFSGPLLNSQEG